MRTTVVTGIGIVAPNGVGTEACWEATLDGRSGIGPLTRFDTGPYPVRLAGEVSGFVAEQHLPGRLLPQTDRNTRLSLAAAAFALEDSRIGAAAGAGPGVGVATAASMGGFAFGQRELQNLWGKGPGHVSVYQAFAWFYAVNTGQVSIRHGLRGPGAALVCDQAGGLDVIGHARRRIRRGTTAMVAGGVDGALCPLGLTGQLTTGALSRSEDPSAAYLPFAEAACGHLPGEGGAFLVLEDAVAANRRGARILGEVAGYAAAFDPDPDDPAPTGLLRALRGALADARVRPSQVDVVFADGAGRRGPDRQEAGALAAVFGAGAVPVTVPKSMTGRLCAGSGALDVAWALLSMRDGLVPPTANVDRPAAGCPVDLVTGAARTGDIRCAVVLARGHGGFNAAVVVRRPPGRRSV